MSGKHWTEERAAHVGYGYGALLWESTISSSALWRDAQGGLWHSARRDEDVNVAAPADYLRAMVAALDAGKPGEPCRFNRCDGSGVIVHHKEGAYGGVTRLELPCPCAELAAMRERAEANPEQALRNLAASFEASDAGEPGEGVCEGCSRTVAASECFKYGAILAHHRDHDSHPLPCGPVSTPAPPSNEGTAKCPRCEAQGGDPEDTDPSSPCDCGGNCNRMPCRDCGGSGEVRAPSPDATAGLVEARAPYREPKVDANGVCCDPNCSTCDDQQ